MWLFALFLAVPLIEIALFIQVGGLIGLWLTLGIVIITAILGTSLVRTQGIAAMSQLRGSFSELRDPTEPLAHGAMILFSGALLLTPGFFTDALGFALLIPAVRTAVYAYLRKRIKVQSFDMGGQHNPRRHGAHPQTNRAGATIIEGEYEDVSSTKQPTHGNSGWTRH